MLGSWYVWGVVFQSSARDVVLKKYIYLCFISLEDFFFSVQGSYWAIDTNPKEDALPTRPKKRPRSGERVSMNSTYFPENTNFLHVLAL